MANGIEEGSEAAVARDTTACLTCADSWATPGESKDSDAGDDTVTGMRDIALAAGTDGGCGKRDADVCSSGSCW